MALLSVANKDGIVDLASCLERNEIGILSTGGTAATLREAGIAVTDVAEVTGRRVAFGGRVKTLDQRLLGAILFDRDDESQQAELAEMGTVPIDMVVVNFYDFAKAASKGVPMSELVESVDIGGPTMVRSAAKNHRHVAVVVDPLDYPRLVKALDAGNGELSREELAALASKAFAVTTEYDAGIASVFAARADLGGEQELTPPSFPGHQGRELALRYGENPHQSAVARVQEPGIRQVGGAPLSYNNLQDAAFAWRAVVEHDRPTCAIVKHAVPCGVASAGSVRDAYERALAADPVSAYGGVVACNGKMDRQTLKSIRKSFYEVIVFPEYVEDVIEELRQAKRLRSIMGGLGTEDGMDGRTLGGLCLSQERDTRTVRAEDLKVVSKASLPTEMVEDLLFAWRVVKHVRSNAIVIARDGRTLGIGGGQTSRVEAAALAVSRAKAKGHDISGAVVASDAFFPFADGLEPLVEGKVAAVIQPGGSKRDKEVIEAADRAGIVMAFTGVRHFSH